MKSKHIIEESFKAVYGPISKAIGNCLITLDNKEIDATAVISAIIAVSIDIAEKATNLSKEAGKKDLLVNYDHVVRFAAMMMISTWELSPELKKALENVIYAGTEFKTTPTSNGILN